MSISLIIYKFVENYVEKLIFTDENQFRNLVLWLEEQKIRHYKVEERDPLRKITSDSWVDAFNQYIRDLECPLKSDKKIELLEWLLGHAVRLEYGDNGKVIFIKYSFVD